MSKKYKIEVTEECIGCGACTSVCPDTFEMDGDKAIVKQAELSELSCEKDAKDCCPVEAIVISEESE
jgi:ferredoxin